jgi:hypothetical protein
MKKKELHESGVVADDALCRIKWYFARCGLSGRGDDTSEPHADGRAVLVSLVGPAAERRFNSRVRPWH